MSELDGDQAFRANSLYGRQPELTYSGALSFLRRRYTRELGEAEVAVNGVPFDASTSNRPGARFGPRAIREASTQLAELPAFPWGFDPFDEIAVSDYGDCFLDFGYPEQIVPTIEAHATHILQSGASMLTLGGDHLVTYPLLRAHAAVHGPLALLQFDAHPDTWPDEPGRLDHGTMLTRAIDEGIIDPERSVQIGIRTHSTPRGFTVLDAPWVHRHGVDAVIERVHSVIGHDPTYLTFDIDCLDPAFAPGTGTPVAGGLSSAQALAILRGLGGLTFAGMDVMEVAPAYDHSEITAIAAATVAHDYLCLLAEKRRSA
ncbi:agmatinase [Salinisphaera sp. USBA-960]|uniref:agmatinase n=1 Tax=Salinisphaera orenii TaxID=856731 RepID=UPI000DBE207E|nr:agmatinase [Salifodinibacter halophilus]NNC26335.1 agmatinase [Salifodinibacter halophilus]